MRFKHASLALVCVGFVCLGSSAPREEKIDQGLFVELTADGFGLLSKFIQEYFLTDLDHETLDDMVIDGPLSSKATVSGILFSAKFKDLVVHPDDQQLKFVVNMQNVEIDAARIQVEQVLSPNKLDCKNTIIRVAENEVVPIKAIVDVSLVDHKVKFETSDMKFTVPWSNYSVEGPAECNFPMNDNVKRVVMRGILAAAQEAIENRVKEQVGGLLPSVAPLLNQITHQSLPLEIKNMPPLPDQKLFLNLEPFALTVDSEKLHFDLSVNIANKGSEKPRTLTKVTKKAAVVLGGVGVNVNILNELVAKILPLGEEYLEIKAKELDQVLNRTRLAAILPDLNAAPLDSDKLRLFVRLTQPFHFSLNNETQALRFDGVDIQTLLMVRINEKWQNYFHFDITFSIGATAKISDDRLRVGLANEHTYDIQGHWDPDYTPQIDRFETEVVDVIMATVFDAAQASYPLLNVKVPVIELYGQRASLGKLTMEDPFIKVQALSVDR